MSESKELDTWIGDVGSHVEEQVDSTRRTRNFAEMVARAHQQAPEQVPASMVAEAAAFAPVVELGSGSIAVASSEADDPALRDFVGDVRAHLEDTVSARRLRGVPVMPATKRPKRTAFWAIGALAGAAAVLLAVGVARRAASIAETDEAASQAVRALEGHETRGMAGKRESAHREVGPRVDSAPAAELQPAPEALPEVVAEPEVVAKPQPVKQPRPGLTRAERLEALDDAARTSWRDGDLATARVRFREIIRLGGAGELAELAYSDLFTLAERAGKVSEQRELWRGYLRRFATGRFADDARAGLCRTAPEANRKVCWTDYLRRHPAGVHGATARAATQGETP